MNKIAVYIAFFCFSLASAAQTDSVNIGFCNGEISNEGSIEMNGKGWVSCAAKLPASVLNAYKGNTISAIRAALVNRVNIDTLKVWVRTGLDEGNIAESFITRSTSQTISKGWNEISLPVPYNIEGNGQEIYIGYSFHQRANVAAVSVVGEPGADMSYLKMGDNIWQDISNKGAVSLEAVVSGSSLPEQDLGLLNASISPWPQSSVTALRINLSVHNYGTKPVTGFTVRCVTGDTECTANIDEKIGSAENRTCTFVIDPQVQTDSDSKWTLSIASIDNGTDENNSNNSVEAICSFLKNVLIEEFTTEKCSNCPRVATYLHSVLESSDEYKTRVAAVCHHAGYYTDDFTQPCDEDMLWMYNNGINTYAPAMMINRQADFDTDNASGSKTAVFLPESPEHLTSIIDNELNTVANAMLGITCEFNADSTELTAHVTCLKNDNLICPKPHLTVYLTENEVKAIHQEGYDGQYYHQHVIRAYNSTWGKPVEWDGNSLSYSYTFPIAQEWKKNDMQVTTILASYNQEDPADCEIENSATEKIIQQKSSADAVCRNDTETKPAEYYNLSGQRVTTLQQGFYIVKYTDGHTAKIIVP